jgi:hypothetical protein
MDKFTLTAKELLDIQSKIKFLKDKAEELGDSLKEICNNETTTKDGYTYQCIERVGSVKYKDIPELKDIDLEPFRGSPVITWKLVYQKQYDI